MPSLSGRQPRRRLAALCTGAAIVGALLAAPVDRAAAADGSLAAITSGANDLRTDGLTSEAMLLTSGGACSPTASRHAATIVSVTAADPSQQAVADQWRGDFLYAPTSDGLAAGQPVTARTPTWDALAASTGQRVVVGSYAIVLVCLTSTGSVVDTWRGSVTFDSPDHWAADPLPVASPATSTPTPSTSSPTSASGVRLSVSPASGDAFQQVTLGATLSTPVTAAAMCVFRDGATVVSRVPLAGGACSVISGAFAPGKHSITATVEAPGAPDLASEPVVATYALTSDSGSVAGLASGEGTDGSAGGSTVTTEVPAGSLAVFTPYTPEHPLDVGTLVLSQDGRSYSASAAFDAVRISDTRAGNPGWSASLTFTDLVGGSGQRIDAHHLGFTGVTPIYLPDNAIRSIDTTDIPASPTRTGGSWEFARALVGAGTGAVDVKADLVLREVPTSTTAGQYTTTITFTLV